MVQLLISFVCDLYPESWNWHFIKNDFLEVKSCRIGEGWPKPAGLERRGIDIDRSIIAMLTNVKRG